MTRTFQWNAFLIVVMAVQFANGQTVSPTTQSISLILHAAAVPDPAMRYRLLPPIGEQTPGNAATQYLMAFSLFPDPQSTEADVENILNMLNTPLSNLDKEKARKLMTDYAERLHQIDIAAHREECDWGLAYRQEGFATLLPYVNRIRQTTDILCLRARLEMADSKFDEAIQTLQVGFSMAEHMCHQGVLVQGLTATGSFELFFDRIAEMQQSPDAPNLYWALADLPGPLLDTRTMAQFEQALVDFSVPGLRGRPIEQLNDDDLQEVFQEFRKMGIENGFQSANANRQNLIFAQEMAGLYGPAKQYLMQHGRSDEQIRKMPAESVLALYFFHQYQHWSDEIYKWSDLPYWQAREAILRTQQAMAAQNDFADNPLSKIVPSIAGVYFQFAEVDRLRAKLQCIEALRAYAASHDGQLPASLDDLIDSPAPIDPITGKPFGYEAHGKTATLRIEGFTTPRSIPQQVIQISMQ